MACQRPRPLRNETFRQFLAEVLGTFVLLCFGNGSVAQYLLGKESLVTGFLALNIAWGIGVTMGVYVSAGVSGGHLNPAVTLTLALLRKLSWWKVPVYFLGQYLGAFLGAACVYATYYDGIHAYDGGIRAVTGANATAGIFATYPSEYLTITGGLFDQVVGTALLMVCVLAITDDRNHGAPKGVVAISVGLCVLAIGTSFGLNCGYAINPARDFGPRLFTYCAGYGTEVFTAGSNWSWVPVVGPHLGAVVGALLYQLFVGLHMPDVEDLENNSECENGAPCKYTTDQTQNMLKEEDVELRRHILQRNSHYENDNGR